MVTYQLLYNLNLNFNIIEPEPQNLRGRHGLLFSISVEKSANYQKILGRKQSKWAPDFRPRYPARVARGGGEACTESSFRARRSVRVRTAQPGLEGVLTAASYHL